MEHYEDEITSLEVKASLLNNESVEKARRDDINNDYSEEVEDDRPELKFDKTLESEEERAKRTQIEEALDNAHSTLKTWQNLALSKFGLVADDLRCKLWPLLLEVDPCPDETIPSLKELSSHCEYQQVVLDVNRSLKRFPPGIPYKQRVALQDQLTVLILRVIIKYPNLRYYQGYHDVAVTCLLVVGEVIAFRIMEKLSTNHLKECMEPTMENTSYRLNYIYALLSKVDVELHDFMDSASVGTMFALPWYLTWFGHSLNQYKDVVRLYDYFLATPPLMPLYVTTSLVVYRRREILATDCDMASIHCLLSQIPDDLDFEQILDIAGKFYKKYPPDKLEHLVKKRVKKEMDTRKKEEQIMRNRLNRNMSSWARLNQNIPAWLLFNCRGRYGILFAAATVLIGYIYYIRATENNFSLKRFENEILSMINKDESAIILSIVSTILISIYKSKIITYETRSFWYLLKEYAAYLIHDIYLTPDRLRL